MPRDKSTPFDTLSTPLIDIKTPLEKLGTITPKTTGSLAGNLSAGPSFKDMFKSYLSRQFNITGSNLGKIGGTVGKSIASPGFGTALDIGSQLFGLKPDEDSTYGAEQQMSNALLQSGNPYTMAAGLYTKGTSMLNQAMGTNTNTYSDTQANAVGINKAEQFGNTALSFLGNTLLPGAGLLAGKTTDAIKSKDVDELRGAFTGTVSDIDTAQTMGGKRYFLGKNKTNSFINNSNNSVELITALNIGNKQKISSVPSTSDMFNEQLRKIRSGQNYQSYGMGIGKEGLKLLSKEELLSIYNSKKDIPAYQNGGSILIPEGALHAHKHHMEDTNPELAEELTKKGIPVIVTNEDGEVTQVAEIEKEEITLSKPLTEQIEELWHKGDEDAMVKAGKIIVEALFTDCTDNADLINRVE